MDPTPSPGFGHFIAQSDALGQALLALLLLMSVASWLLVAFKGFAQWRRQRRSAAFLAGFWNVPTLGAVQQALSVHGAHDPFGHLTARLTAAFPQCPPYEGRYDEIVPHLTLDTCSAEVGIDSTRAALGSLLPARCVALHLQLAWYEAGACRVLASWPLEGPGA